MNLEFWIRKAFPLPTDTPSNGDGHEGNAAASPSGKCDEGSESSEVPMVVGPDNDGRSGGVSAAPSHSGVVEPDSAAVPPAVKSVSKDGLSRRAKCVRRKADRPLQPFSIHSHHAGNGNGGGRYESPHDDPAKPFPNSEMVSVISDPGVHFIWRTMGFSPVLHSFVPRPKSAVRIGPQMIAPDSTWGIIDEIAMTPRLDIWDFETGGPIGASLTRTGWVPRPKLNWSDVRGAALRPLQVHQRYRGLEAFGGYAHCHAPFEDLEASVIRARINRFVTEFQHAGRLRGPWFVATMLPGAWWTSTMDVFISLR